ncbi:MAG: hypothetical protein LUH42_00355, partial [Oscillospiraceae bacterium]|nr:hypothetical protein [Oscillospiraceae bacterium]
MKTIISLLLAVFLCMGVTALADGSPEAAPEAVEEAEAQAPSPLEETSSIGEAAGYEAVTAASQESAEPVQETDDENGEVACYDAVTVAGAYNQTEARAMLELINQFRTGEDAWVWDEEDEEQIYPEELEALSYDYALEQIAMTRAAELALSFSHTRPD